MNEILLRENEKVSAVKESPANIESDFDKNELYHIENMSLEDTKEKLEWHKCTFECEQKNTYGIENLNDMTCIHDNKVNNIAECNSIYDIINHPKHTKKIK